ncbi:flavin reductase family protein [Sulfitobacter noctilucae]|uniref:flavin reductase family protein n=1 Tax=Sulfitobacter noctilucae TaxID=1342302 RepID=UPI0030C6EB75
MGLYGQMNPGVATQAPMDNDLSFFAPGDAAALRSAFGRFGTGVTVITTQTDAGPMGMTANSFSSVSLDPPLVLWSAALRSKRHDVFATTQTYCIHVLGQDQEAMALHFASQGHDFTSFDWTAGPGGAPQLEGCLAAFHCKLDAVHPAGDHSIILGEVTHAAERPGDGAGLLFDKGRFGVFTAKAAGP